MRNASLRSRLAIAFIGLAVLPLLIVGILLAGHTYDIQRRQALLMQRQISDGVAKEVEAHINALVDRLTLTARLWPSNPVGTVHTMLSALLGHGHRFSEIAFIDADGREVDRQSLIEVVTDGDLRHHGNDAAFTVPIRTGRTWFGPVTYDPTTGQPTITVAVPVYPLGGLSPSGVLLAVVRLKKVWDLIAQTPAEAGGEIYILDEAGRLIAHRNPSMVLRGTTVPIPPDLGAARGLTQDQVLLATRHVVFGERHFIVVAEKASREALGLAYDTALLIAAIVIAALATAAVVAILAQRRILHPLHVLAGVAQRIKEGDLSLRAPSTTRDEIGDLAAAFNEMTDRLRGSLEDLERRVAERTRDLSAQIAERINAEQALWESQQRFRDIAQAASDWFWEMGPDLRFSLLLKGDSAGDDTGAFLGRTIHESLGPPPGDAPEKRWRALADDLAAGRPFRNLACMLSRGDRSRHLRISGKPFHDEDRRFLGYRGTMNDVTAEIEADARALRAEQRLHEAIEVISEGFVLCDSNDRLLLCNGKFREFFPQMSDYLVLGASFPDLLRRSGEMGLVVEATADPAGWLKRRQTHRRRQMSHIQRTITGRWLLVSERRTESGNVVGVYTDITELKASEQALAAAKAAAERAAAAKSDFLANMSHELRTPLNAVIGFSDAILSEIHGPLDNASYRSYVADIHASGMHLLELINDVLDLAKVEAGKLELSFAPVDARVLVSQIMAMLRERATTSAIAMRAELVPGLPPIRGDERRLKQILLNLLSNAIKFTPEGGRVVVRGGAVANQVILEVVDTGIGIAPGDMARIMEPFGQIESAQSRNHHGTGLGLPLTRRLVALHGGSMAFDSEPGRGTTVRLSLPAMSVDDA